MDTQVFDNKNDTSAVHAVQIVCIEERRSKDANNSCTQTCVKRCEKNTAGLDKNV